MDSREKGKMLLWESCNILVLPSSSKVMGWGIERGFSLFIINPERKLLRRLLTELICVPWSLRNLDYKSVIFGIFCLSLADCVTLGKLHKLLALQFPQFKFWVVIITS
jgi:hypothetical protein